MVIMSEKALETQILDYLSMLPHTFAFKVNTTGISDPIRKVYRTNANKHCHNGTSDILGTCKGKFFAIEVKYGKNKASQNQKLFLSRVEEGGGKTLVTNDFDECVIWFNEQFPGLHEYRPPAKTIFDH